MKKTPSERIEFILDHMKLKPIELASRLPGGHGPAAISNILHGRTKSISAELARKLANTCNVTEAWALTGEGEPFPDTYRVRDPEVLYTTVIKALDDHGAEDRHEPILPVILAGDPERVEALEGREAFWAIPYATMPVGAGAGRLTDDEIGGYVVIHTRIVHNIEDLRAVQIDGDSMEPVLPDGSIVAIDRSQRDPEKLDAAIVAARLGPDETVIKRLHVCRHCLTLQSFNPRYPEIRLEELNGENPILGMVICAWQDFR